jgi:hypothetical protein
MIKIIKTGKSIAKVIIDGKEETKLKVRTNKNHYWNIFELYDGIERLLHSFKDFKNPPIWVIQNWICRDPNDWRKKIEVHFKTLGSKGLKLGIDFSTRRSRIDKIEELIQFDCRFDSCGNCKIYTNPRMTGKNCCGGCSHFKGHFNEWCDPDSVDFLIRNYNFNTGYWREGFGCVIPRKWRSDICLKYNCGLIEDANIPGLARESLQKLLTLPFLPITLNDAINKTEIYINGKEIKHKDIGKIYRISTFYEDKNIALIFEKETSIPLPIILPKEKFNEYLLLRS